MVSSVLQKQQMERQQIHQPLAPTLILMFAPSPILLRDQYLRFTQRSISQSIIQRLLHSQSNRLS